MAGAVRRNCTNPLNARAHESKQPNSTEHDDHTNRCDTALSSRGWLHDVCGTPWHNTEEKQLRLNHQCRLVRILADLWLRRPVTTGYADWLRRQPTVTGYAGWLRRLVTPAGYGDWLRWWWTEAHGVETIEVETKTGRYEMMKGRDDGIVKWRSGVTKLQGDNVKVAHRLK